MVIAKAIAMRHLSSSYKIRFFSAGGFQQAIFNKLFLLYPRDHASGTVESFIMRVSLSVDLYFKTASEVATLRFVRKYTSIIPVPRVIASDPSAVNELCFKWILMTKLLGVPLNALWGTPALVWEDRI